MAASLWVRTTHQDDPDLCAVVRVELDREGGYAVQGGRIEKQSGLLRSPKVKPIAEFTADDFSKILAEHGFEENEIRFQIEESIEGLHSEEVL